MSRRPSAPRPIQRPLVVSTRPALLDDLLRLAAAAGVELDVAPDAAAARASWREASLVVVDDDTLLAEGGAAGLPRRDDVVLVGTDERTVEDPELWRRAVALGAEHVVFLPDAEGWLVDRLAEARDGASREGRLIGVVGGRGGAGATTLAAALAVTAVGRGSTVLLVDLDPLGGGIDLALGVEGASGLRWTDLSAARGRINGATLRQALPCAGELPVLSWDRGSDVEVPFEAARAVLDSAVRACDVVVVDLPRAGGDAAAHVAARAEELLLVVPAEVRAVAAAERVLRRYRPMSRAMRAVVRGPAPSGLSAEAVGEALSIELAGELRAEPRLAQSLERGEPPAHRGRGPLADLCTSLLGGSDR